MHRGQMLGMVGVLLWMGPAAMVMGQGQTRGGKDGGDARRARALEARLDEQDALAGRGLEARVDGNKITLTGTVKSEPDRALAEKVAKEARGTTVVNQLTVEPPAARALAPAASTEPPGARGAQSDPQRRDPLVGSMPAELTPTREARFRSMGMPDPKLERQRQEAAKASETTMTPADAPATGSDHAQTGNQSAPPQRTPPKPNER